MDTVQYRDEIHAASRELGAAAVGLVALAAGAALLPSPAAAVTIVSTSEADAGAAMLNDGPNTTAVGQPSVLDGAVNALSNQFNQGITTNTTGTFIDFGGTTRTASGQGRFQLGAIPVLGDIFHSTLPPCDILVGCTTTAAIDPNLIPNLVGNTANPYSVPNAGGYFEFLFDIQQQGSNDLQVDITNLVIEFDVNNDGQYTRGEQVFEFDVLSDPLLLAILVEPGANGNNADLGLYVPVKMFDEFTAT